MCGGGGIGGLISLRKRMMSLTRVDVISSKSRCHLIQSMPFPTTVDATCNIFTTKPLNDTKSSCWGCARGRV